MRSYPEKKVDPASASQPDLDDLNHLIYEIYALALFSDSSRTELRQHLLIELSSDREKFEKTVDELIQSPAPKKMTIAEKEFVLDHWEPSFWLGSKGSQMRIALAQAKADVDRLKYHVAIREAKEAIIKKLESTNLSFSACEALRLQVDASWRIASDLLFLISFKQAQILFETCVLQYKTAYQSAIFIIEDILYLLSEGNAENISTCISNCGSTYLEIPRLNDFFADLKGENFAEYKDVAVSFVEICKEWFQIGAYITTCKSVLDEKSNLRELEVAKFLWNKVGDCLDRASSCEGIRSGHSTVMAMIRRALKESNGDIAALFMKEIPKCESSREFLAYKLSQHLRWIVSLYLYPGPELLVINVEAIKEFLGKHPSSLYLLPEAQKKSNKLQELATSDSAPPSQRMI
jgi:hypothetical protein